MNIKTLFIENIVKNITILETSESDLDAYGNVVVSGSIEIEFTDSTGKLWGGRVCNIDGDFELVEFFPKLFFSDVSVDTLIKESKNYIPDVKNQEFDYFSDFID